MILSVFDRPVEMGEMPEPLGASAGISLTDRAKTGLTRVVESSRSDWVAAALRAGLNLNRLGLSSVGGHWVYGGLAGEIVGIHRVRGIGGAGGGVIVLGIGETVPGGGVDRLDEGTDGGRAGGALKLQLVIVLAADPVGLLHGADAEDDYREVQRDEEEGCGNEHDGCDAGVAELHIGIFRKS